MKIVITTKEMRAMEEVDANIAKRIMNKVAMSDTAIEAAVLRGSKDITETMTGIKLDYLKDTNEIYLEVSDEITIELIKEYGSMMNAIVSIIMGSKTTFQNLLYKHATEKGVEMLNKKFNKKEK
jgi:hypothetical protein